MALDILGEIVSSLVFLTLPGVVAAVVWSPFLIAARVRSLFQSLPISSSLPANYVVVMIGLSVPWIIGTGIAVTTSDPEGAALSNALLNVIFPLSFLYTLVLPLAAIFGLPQVGIDWASSDSRLTTWFLLTIGTAWYCVVFGGPLLLIGIILALPT